MGEHGTWFDYLNRFSWWSDVNHWAQSKLGRSWEWQMFGESGWTLTHVLITICVVLFVTWGALAFFRGTRTKDEGLIPPRKMNLRNFFEFLAESLFGMVEGAMGEKNAKRFYPLIGALFIFILFNNLFALIPGFVAPTDSLKTNVGLAIFIFLLTHIYGVKEHGLAYFKHFLGPSPALIPLMLPIELISHLARPMSLAVRLMGNMMADHKVVMSFFALVPLLVPLPFLVLGLLICLVQALVFCTLTMVYIGSAIEHEEH
ncbi:MAG: F0F1 ATP synthase subunit A [Deltaproteobacteria bacterium]|nr:F0F1 ATP synthase subunit A [Deltaproteobacteria bacterium]MDQ3300123.1 F0F1 ATP synthase subunit A [Myxococcota bacterium]